MNEPLKVAVAGLGIVGGGAVRLLHEHADLIAHRCGRRINLVKVADPNRRHDLGECLSGVPWVDDAMALVDDPGIDVIVELIGRSDGIARRLCETALERGVSVVTANKALIAEHGNALMRLATASGATLAFEAAVAGGIPIIKSIREGLSANAISRVYGILNGTCNYILSGMRESGREFDEVLREAQAHGYAEADPSFDIDGIDTAHKLAILASLAFDGPIDFESVHVEGIRAISPLDIQYAGELGYRIKLLGIAERIDEGLLRRVHPCMVPVSTPIAHIDGVFNAVVAHGDFVDSIMHMGRGAGERPTASAVVADLADIAAGRQAGMLSASPNAMPPASMATHRGEYYARLMVVDQAGAFADIAAILRDHDVSMESILQRVRAPGEPIPVVVTTHQTSEAAVTGALRAIHALDAIVEPPCMIRIESF